MASADRDPPPDPTRPTSPRPRNAPEQVGPYKIVRLIASGGMASVHLARTSHGISRFVALKRPHPHLSSDPKVVKMFESEARLVAQLDHENICPLVDFGTDEAGPYLVMPYLHGEPHGRLMELCAEHQPPNALELMVYVGAAVADGLWYAHNARGPDRKPLGLVHRDITPHNIFVTFDGAVKILDFGIAKAVALSSGSVSQQLKGKYAYMAPEQIKGEAIDHRTDLFALGVVLWESLAGRRLFKRKNDMATLLAIGECKVQRLADVNPAVPRELSDLISRTLSKSPSDRPESARELGRELRRILAAKASVLSPTEVGQFMCDVFPERADELDPVTARIESGGKARPLPELEGGPNEPEVDGTPTARLNATDPSSMVQTDNTGSPVVVRPVPSNAAQPFAAKEDTEEDVSPTMRLDSRLSLPDLTAPQDTASGARSESKTPHEDSTEGISRSDVLVAVARVDTGARSTGEDGDEQETSDGPEGPDTVLESPEQLGTLVSPLRSGAGDLPHAPTVPAMPSPLARAPTPMARTSRGERPDTKPERSVDRPDRAERSERRRVVVEPAPPAIDPSSSAAHQVSASSVQAVRKSDLRLMMGGVLLIATCLAVIVLVLLVRPGDRWAEDEPVEIRLPSAVSVPSGSETPGSIAAEGTSGASGLARASATSTTAAAPHAPSVAGAASTAPAPIAAELAEPGEAPATLPAESAEERSRRARARIFAKSAQTALLLGELDEAKRALDDCLALFERPDCHRMLGVLANARGESARAIQEYRRYLELAPRAADAPRIRDLIRLAESDGQPAPGGPLTLTEALRLSHDGRAALFEGRHAEAEKHLRRCADEAKLPGCYRQLGVLFATRKDRASAVTHYKRYLELLPEAPDAPKVRGLIEELSKK